VSKALTVETVRTNLRALRYSYSSNAFCQFFAWNKHLPLVTNTFSSMVNLLQETKLKKNAAVDLDCNCTSYATPIYLSIYDSS
jgi:hypothetical protein